MTSHLQIAFPTAILWFSEIFTKFHTTFHIHNNKWRHFRDSALELGSWPPFSTIAGAYYPSGIIQAPANYAPTFRPHLHIMAHYGYSHIVSIAPYLAQIEMDKQPNTHWKHLEVCQLILTMYKQNLKCQMVCFASTKRKQSCRYCKTIDKNLHRHHLTHRLPTSRSHTQFISCWLLTSAGSSIRSHLWWPCGWGQSADSPCLSRTYTSSCHRLCGPCALRGLTHTPVWCTYTLIKVSFITILNPLTTQLNVSTKYCAKPCCALWILTVNNLPLLDPQ